MLDGDSIYHPGVTLKYQIQEHMLTLIRGDEGIEGSEQVSGREGKLRGAPGITR